MLRSASRSTVSSASSSHSAQPHRQVSPHVQVKRGGAATKPVVHAAVCLPLTHIKHELAWAVKQTVHDSLHVPSVVAADPLVHHPINDGPKYDVLPLYLTPRHFSAVLPMLQDQVRSRFILTLSDTHVPRLPVPTSTVRQAMVTTYFPHLVRNMTVHLALGGTPPTLTDLEALTQIHLLWRAALHRAGPEARDALAATIQAHATNLALGGAHARKVPLLDLLTLMHVAEAVGAPKATWARLARRVVEENTIRLVQYMQYVRRCAPCAERYVGHAGSLADKAMRFATKLEQGKVDGRRFVHWSVVRVHVQFLQALRGMPRVKSTGALHVHQVGGYLRAERLEPGLLARTMHDQVSVQDRMDTWDAVMVGMGAAPMCADELSKWVAWCTEQGHCAHQSVHKCPMCTGN